MSDNKPKKNTNKNVNKGAPLFKQEAPKTPIPENNQPNRLHSSVAIQGSGIPPEAFIYTLPHLDSKDREKFIEIIDKENQRVYAYNIKKTYLNFFVSILSILVGVGLIVFFTIFNKENLISEIFKILGYILGGYGLTFLIPRKK